MLMKNTPEKLQKLIVHRSSPLQRQIALRAIFTGSD